MKLVTQRLFISWIGIIVCIVAGSILYAYYPYYYVLTYAILCICIASLGIAYTTPTLWNIIIYGIYIVCILSSIIYFNYKLKPTISILVGSFVIYLVTRYLMMQWSSSNTQGSNNNIIESAHATFVLISFGILIGSIWAIFNTDWSKSPTISSSDKSYLYTTILVLGIVISMIILLYMYTLRYHIIYAGIYAIPICIIIVCIWFLIMNSYKPANTSFLINTPTLVSRSKIIISSDHFNRIRKNTYKYSIMFEMIIFPSSGTNQDVSIINIDNNLEIKYNNATGILSFWGIRQGSSNKFELLYGHYIIPLQTWISVVINIIDGKLDIGINHILKMSTNIILTNQHKTGNVSIGDNNASWIKGYIKNIHISDTLYIM